MWSRGLRTDEEVQAFLYPSWDLLIRPENLLKDLEPALQLLLKAKENKQKLLVFGDYDVDGSTAACLLVSSLRAMGFPKVEAFIPHRIKEGYGLSAVAAKRVVETHPAVGLVLTCDCGVSSFEGIEFLKERFVPVIVTDHHSPPPKRVRADAVINPRQADCFYPDKNLAGVGVAFLLMTALRRALGLRNFRLKEVLDLVAVGTICDMVPLQGLNRILVREGLKEMKSLQRPIWKALAEQASQDLGDLEAEDIGFVIGPRLNAAGRVGDPEAGLRALLSASRLEAQTRALELETLNRERRRLQTEQTDRVLSQLLPEESAHLIWSEDFHLGLVGLIASKVVERTRKPACVLTRMEDEVSWDQEGKLKDSVWKGSLRAPEGFHLAQILQGIQSQEELLLSFGGHAAAAGVSVLESQLPKFREAFRVFCKRGLSEEPPWKPEFVVREKPSSAPIQFEDFEILKPFGQANPPPQALVLGFSVENLRILKEKHLRLEGKIQGKKTSVLQFQSPWVSLFQKIQKDRFSLDFIGQLSENKWRGRSRWEWRLLDFQGWGDASKKEIPIKRESSDEVISGASP